jgi:hypothetical protein
MQVSGTYVKDFLTSKFGKILIVTVLVYVAYTIVASQLSSESVCKREVDSYLRSLPSEITSNKRALESVKNQELAKCLNESK